MPRKTFTIFDTQENKEVFLGKKLLVANTQGNSTLTSQVKLLNQYFPDRFIIKENVLSPRECVLNYLHSTKVNSLEPLDFWYIQNDWNRKTGRPITINKRPDNLESDYANCKTLRDKIVFILKCSIPYVSVYIDNDGVRIRETLAGRRRSSLDIWRHLLYYDKSVTIFEVMKELALMYKDYLVNENYCTVVKRRVFTHNTYHYGGNAYPTGYDEYGLTLKEWSEI